MARHFLLTRRLIACAYIISGIITSASFADLLPIAWDGGAMTDDWTNPLNWDLDVVPDNNQTNQFDVTIESADVDLEQDAITISGLTIGSTASLEINNGLSLTLVGGTFENNNEVSLLSTDFIIDGDVSLTGGGTITLSAATTNRIRGAAYADRLTNENNVIQGAGFIGANLMALTNRGTIAADGEGTLTIDPSVSGAVNSGTLTARADSTLWLYPGTYTNFEDAVEGQILVENGGVVRTLAADIVGGTVEVQGSGVLQLDDTTVTGLTLQNSATGTISIIDSSTLNADVINPVGGRLVIENGKRLTLMSSGICNNEGEISIEGATSTTGIKVSGGDVTISGGGTVRLADFAGCRIYGNTYTDRLINDGNTIEGAGYLCVNSMGLTNRGTISANATQQLYVDPSIVGVVNQGTMKATFGSTLRLQAGEFTNHEGGTDGLILAEDGGTVHVLVADIIGGAVEVQDEGALVLDDSSITEATVLNASDGTVTIIDNVTIGDVLTNLGTIEYTKGKLTFAGTGTFTNDGDINITSDGTLASLYFDTATVLMGSGTITLSDSYGNAIRSSVVSTFTNTANTISGAGQLGANTLSIINQGTISATGTAWMRIDPPSIGTGFDNQGTLNAIGQGGLQILDGPFTTGGQVYIAEGSSLTRYGDYTQTAGSTVVNGDLSATSGVSISGMLSGGGTITADVMHLGNGSVAPGQSIGTLTIDGTYEQSSSTILEIELGGITPGEADLLAVSGRANLDGILSVSLVADYYPEAGQTIEILSAASIDGTFTAVLPVNIPSPLTVSESYEDTRVLLTFGAIPGLGACCHEDGSCEVITEGSCDLPGDLFTLGAPCSPYTCPELVECCTGDVNGDQLINGLDVDAFVAGVLNPPMPGTVPFCRLDANEDRLDVDIDDVPPFVALLLDGTMCEITCCPGDLNGDNLLNGSDIAPLQDAIDNPPPRGTIEFCRADVNEDLYVNNADATALTLKLLMGETCPGSELSLKMILSDAHEAARLPDCRP